MTYVKSDLEVNAIIITLAGSRKVDKSTSFTSSTKGSRKADLDEIEISGRGLLKGLKSGTGVARKKIKRVKTLLGRAIIGKRGRQERGGTGRGGYTDRRTRTTRLRQIDWTERTWRHC